jgi:hypothetical protein
MALMRSLDRPDGNTPPLPDDKNASSWTMKRVESPTVSSQSDSIAGLMAPKAGASLSCDNFCNTVFVVTQYGVFRSVYPLIL